MILAQKQPAQIIYNITFLLAEELCRKRKKFVIKLTISSSSFFLDDHQKGLKHVHIFVNIKCMFN
ncbi:hypothetical protein SPSP110954_03505 [Sporolactobacillus spathodeae]